MRRPRLLDLFCGAGGAAMGYHRAGFEVVGVDIKPQPRYPFEFHQADALDFMAPGGYFDGVRQAFEDGGYAAIHASPPCQRYSSMTKRWGREDAHPDLIAATRECLQRTGLTYVIENVTSAPLLNPMMLCGSMFGLQADEGSHLRRHRNFESNVWLVPAFACSHVGRVIGVYGHPGGSSKRDGIQFASWDEWKTAMGIDWMSRDELSESIPPAYTEYIGRQLMTLLTPHVTDKTYGVQPDMTQEMGR